VFICIFSNQLIKKVKSQKQGRRQILAPIIIKSYNGWINQKRGKENENKQKKELLNFPLIFFPLGHRSRSKAERASLLEEDDDDGDDAAEDSAP